MAVSCMHNEKENAQYYRNYRNSSIIVDITMRQILRSTERISSLDLTFTLDIGIFQAFVLRIYQTVSLMA